jgi:hypothetical protein
MDIFLANCLIENHKGREQIERGWYIRHLLCKLLNLGWNCKSRPLEARGPNPIMIRILYNYLFEFEKIQTNDYERSLIGPT